MDKQVKWSSQFGFLMAAIGSAVGLGNLWAFPYKLGKNGGFAFLLIYIMIVIILGFTITLSELAIGRKAGKAVYEAWLSVSSKYRIFGFFGFLAPLLIIFFYSMLGGYCLKYLITNINFLFSANNNFDSVSYFTSFYTNQFESSLYTFIFIMLSVIIVMFGVVKGIERFSKWAMPMLFVMLLILIIYALSLKNAKEALIFLFKPDFSLFKGSGFIKVFAAAAGQAFFSLSLGMGITITYGSYLKRKVSLPFNALVICLADTLIAILAAIAIMPAVFSFNIDPNQGPGLLFVSLQSVFHSLGTLGHGLGIIFYFLVFIAAITSAIALLETIIAVIKEYLESKKRKISRFLISFIISIIIIIGGILVSMDGLGANGFMQILRQNSWLDTLDLIAEGILMPISALAIAIIFAWIKPHYLIKEIKHGSKFKWQGFYHFSLKYLAPLITIMVLYGQLVNFGIIKSFF